MRIFLHIGPDAATSDRVQRILDAKRNVLRDKGVLYARTPGTRSHTRLFMASTDPENVDALRFHRGFANPDLQANLRAEIMRKLDAEVTRFAPHTLILSAHHLATGLTQASELTRLRDMLSSLSSDIRPIAFIDDPARMLVRHYRAQLLEGRSSSLGLELRCARAPSFWDTALATRPKPSAGIAVFPETQGACFWLDFLRLQSEWEQVFGAGQFDMVTLDPSAFATRKAPDILTKAFGLPESLGQVDAEKQPATPSAAWLTRCRQFNGVLLAMMKRDQICIPRQLWKKLLQEIRIDGAPERPGALSALSRRFAPDLAELAKRHDGIDTDLLVPDPETSDWQEADPEFGFRPTQYLMAFQWRINHAVKPAASSNEAPKGPLKDTAEIMPEREINALLSDGARAVMPPIAKQNFAKLRTSAFAPHNKIGHVNEEELAAAYKSVPQRTLPQGSSGNVVVGCMKNEAPYILEWVAYHRAVGFDNFLIYTNDCDDGTDALLNRLQALGIVQHRSNGHWTGNSPQQFALDLSLKEPLIRNADWIAHIDVDEFVNIRCGNGTLTDLFERVPNATNLAMTWRLFGHNDITRFEDRLVIEQFDTCAPKYCPKPHTVWGFKTLFRNIGAYAKISCHRPNKLEDAYEQQVKWVNGSGHDMTRAALRNGWRNSRKTIGYDLIQLNHYALRSAESFLIKRQRGRALHVDRSIGLNYWIRMDWSVHRDITIKRNLPRLRTEFDTLMADPELQDLHDKGVAWHRARADALHAMPEFSDLYQKAVALKLTEMERVAYALALDMET